MSQENQITLRGYLTAEPKLFQKTAEMTPLTEIRVGCTPRRLNRETGEWHDLPTSYYRVKAWRRLAINAVSSLHKGDRVFIRGRFYMSNWVDSQQRPRSTLEVEADTIGHDLSYGWSHYLRGSRQPGNSAPAGSGEAARQDTEGPDHGREPGHEGEPDFEDLESRDDYSGDTGADGPDELAEAEPAPDGQAPAADGHVAVAGDPQGDARDAQPAAGTQDTAAWLPADSVDDAAQHVGMVEREVEPEKEPVPF